MMRPERFDGSVPIDLRNPFNDTTMQDIATILRNTGHEPWSLVPRLYIVLRTIDQLRLIGSFLDAGFTDQWFPFTRRTLPPWLYDQAMKETFLLAQRPVLTKALDLERENGKHRHFKSSADLPFIQISELGRGGFGVVHKVQSTISHKSTQGNVSCEV